MGKNNNKNNKGNNKKTQKGLGNNTMKNAINKAKKESKEKIVHGKVKWFDVKKGYGFIIGDDGKEYFCHHSGIVNGKTYTGLENSDTVTFKVIAAGKGPQAVAISRVEKKNKESVSDDLDNTEEISEETVKETEENTGSEDDSESEVASEE